MIDLVPGEWRALPHRSHQHGICCSCVSMTRRHAFDGALFADPLKGDAVSTFEVEHLAGFVRCCDLTAEILDDPADLGDLFRV